MIDKKVFSKEKSYKCKLCEETFPSLSARSQEKTHGESKPFGCETCGKAFIKQYLLNAHQKIHNGLEIISAGFVKVHSEEKPSCES
ncbi:putative zinc finger protein [Apostichopus japonicus]|uniref:Putative zinc finger protein n=1 Tax=Stichopus japonicus TaxID=307972 RepID=A0A2G8L256_STIJA|nr:putative zinc finger protein [Apostichopus japonicus]